MHALVFLHSATAFALFLLASFVAPTLAARDAACWMQKTPTGPMPIPTFFKTCYDAVKLLLPDPRRKENHGYQVPRQWRRGNCVVRIDMHDDDAEDTLTFLDLATAAGTVNVVCVARPPHFGGTLAVGARQIMNVSVFGSPFGKPFLNPGLNVPTMEE
ncbi:hypothetical protein XANCAGTX0491_005202 [Xanthoria calcicola]